MKTTTFELALHRRPYGLELQPSRNGLVLRPRCKARASWPKLSVVRFEITTTLPQPVS